MENCFKEIDDPDSDSVNYYYINTLYETQIFDVLSEESKFVEFNWPDYYHYLDFKVEEWFEEDADLSLSDLQGQLMKSVEEFNERQRSMREEMEEDEDEYEQ